MVRLHTCSVGLMCNGQESQQVQFLNEISRQIHHVKYIFSIYVCANILQSFKDLHWKLEEFDYIKKSIAYRKCYLKNPKFQSMEKYEKKFWNGSIIFNMYVHISNVSKICIKNFFHYIKQVHVCTICWKFQILEVIISIKNIIFIKKYIQCSLGLLPPVLSPNLPITKILVCPDLPHYKYLAILPNSATAIHHSFSDTKVIKPI